MFYYLETNRSILAVLPILELYDFNLSLLFYVICFYCIADMCISIYLIPYIFLSVKNEIIFRDFIMGYIKDK